MKILKRALPNHGQAPCVIRYEYSIDGGQTWMNERNYNGWKSAYFKEVKVYV